MLDQESKDYKAALLSIGIFGGMQVFILLISVLKNKLLAIWIGVEGFGIQNLLFSTMTLFFILSNCGLQSSTVRDIAANHDSIEKLAKKISSVKWWNRLVGFIGACSMLIMSPLLATWIFDDVNKWYWFAILAPTILFMNLYNGYYSILQGLREIKKMAKASLVGAISGFICSMPIFYFLRIDGIVLALFVLMFSTLMVSSYIYRKTNVPNSRNSISENFNIGKSTLKLGLALSVNSVFVEFTAFLIKLFVSKFGGIEQVGLFQAGWAINASYISVVFTAMAKDYLPRISSISADNVGLSQSVKQQGIMSILILLPLLSLMIVAVEYVVRILYSDDFIVISTMTTFLLLGSLIKASSWPVAYVFIAKSDKKSFLFNELSTRIIVVPFYMLAYYLFGLNGIGMAFVFEHIFYFVWIAISVYWLYGIKYDWEFWKFFIISITFLIVLVLLKMYYNISSLFYALAVFVAISYSCFELLKRMDISTLIKILKK